MPVILCIHHMYSNENKRAVLLHGEPRDAAINVNTYHNPRDKLSRSSLWSTIWVVHRTFVCTVIMSETGQIHGGQVTSIQLLACYEIHGFITSQQLNWCDLTAMLHSGQITSIHFLACYEWWRQLTFSDVITALFTRHAGNIGPGNIELGDIAPGNIDPGNIGLGNIRLGNIALGNKLDLSWCPGS